MKKRKDGLYQAQMTVEVAGVKKQKYFYGKTQAEVKRKMRDYEAEKERARTFREAAEEWMEVHNQEVQYYTASCYVAPLKNVIEYFGDLPVNMIRPGDVQNYIDDFAKKGWARQTVKLRLLVFKHAVISGDITDNPAQYAQLPKKLRSSRGEEAQEDAISLIKENCKNPAWLLPYFLLYTGCRRSEAIAVEYEDIDFKNNTVSINKKVEFHGEKPVLVHQNKTEKSERKIILLDRLKEVLNPSGHGYLFQGKRGGLLTKSELGHYWEKLNLNIGLHQLRHSYVTMLYEAGIDPEIAMTQTGHSNISTMRDIYTHIRNSRLKQTAKTLNEFDG